MTEKYNFGAFTRNYLDKESKIAREINLSPVEDLINELIFCSNQGRRVFIAGNGGSAATADHFAVDLGVGSHIRNGRNIVSAISLSSNASIVTALGNDISFESVFAKHFEVMKPEKGDLVVVISASGNSPNIIKLLETAKQFQVKTCAFTGFDGGKAKKIVDISIHVPTETGEYGIVEDLHLSICHSIAESMRR